MGSTWLRWAHDLEIFKMRYLEQGVVYGSYIACMETLWGLLGIGGPITLKYLKCDITFGSVWAGLGQFGLVWVCPCFFTAIGKKMISIT